MKAKQIEEIALVVGALGALVLAWGGAMMILALRSYQGPTESHVRREKWVQLIGGVLVAAGFAGVLLALLQPK